MTRQGMLPLDLPPALASASALSEAELSLREAIEAFLRAGRGRGGRHYSARTLHEYRLRLSRLAQAGFNPTLVRLRPDQLPQEVEVFVEGVSIPRWFD